ncbi:Serine/threonine-specific protein phosphatase/bis(5-nucleosyl)-tetraphosphatase [Fusarium oxysporum f. sp. vasinfectum]|nr:Serine/threonine-specific protein phosphatase/bis(5-nucleosyl)-tetraphosphatase [Fusarium oxysporum f. sp. vasinfectum]KAK2667768.1 Serine/threonine-specific protein phosphatase/bis(5-nucleosyl)-tetraphosphatase [Fusarium oxysporum f. sp. vasinfectum]KAK2922907.1 Serine/threonine-specific protein phosphatase/bis5-nucleosyl-tetraphosphatase [Fusarium oxysporum f. sp. vasinfectum]
MQNPEVAVCPATSDRPRFINGEDKIEPILEALPGLLKEEMNIQEIPIPSEGYMIVVGDLHGQFRNLMEILHQEGPPSAVRHYLFKGDIVDRGPSSVECAILLLYLRHRFPEYVFINRGNHEDQGVNAQETFVREITDRGFQRLHDTFQQCFHNLSLGKIIKAKTETYLALHGGIPLHEGDPLSIKDMNSLERNMSCANKQDLLTQILWNDMSDENGNQDSQRAGWGLKVGQEALERFLRKENLKYLIRSHTEEPHGWRLVFSAFSEAAIYLKISARRGLEIVKVKFEEPCHEDQWRYL